MKRKHSRATGHTHTTTVCEDGAYLGGPLERFVLTPESMYLDNSFTTLSSTRLSPAPEHKPSKIRRHGSRIMSAIRSLAKSNSSVSVTCIEPPNTEIPPYSPSPSYSVVRKLSSVFLNAPSTVVHRTQFKSRPSLKSHDRGMVDINLDGSPSSTSHSSSGKSSTAPRVESTGKTSLDSKISMSSKGLSQHSSENKKLHVEGGGSHENALTPIAEVDMMDPEPIPTIVTVEKAAAAKVFFECHYNKLTSADVSPRSVRRRQLELALYEDTNASNTEKDERRRAWAQQESNHLRETRMMKIRGTKALKGKDITSSSFETVKILGKGSFGVVRLTPINDRSLPTVIEISITDLFSNEKEIYAMKVIRKSDMLRNSQEGHLRAERDFLVAAEGSRWVVPLIASFQDLNNLYLVMDYMPGGDFLGLLIRDNVLSESMTKFYIAEMILCIEEAHALRWIHRDVKPDNFLISASGHLKISDFGLAFDGHWSHDQAYFNNHRYSLLTKLGINVEGDSLDKKEGRAVAAAMKMATVVNSAIDRHERNVNGSESEGILNWRNRVSNRSLARSVVGTSQYMAPEVVRGELYDARCDWWSVAVILYECLYGHTPFLAEEGGRQQTKLNILHHKKTFGFPSKPTVSRRCQDLIRSIIQEKDDRLCSKRYKVKDQPPPSRRDYTGHYVYPHDAEDIKAHKWFRDIHWDRLHLVTPPFVPNLKDTDDTHYFDEEDPISDFSVSASHPQPTTEEITCALKKFNRELQILATGYIERPYDSVRLKKVEREIESFNIPEDQKHYLKEFVTYYGRKEKKRPRDRLLRDRELGTKVLELRKRGAFLGYTYRRVRVSKENLAYGSVVASLVKKNNVWHRARLSIH